MHAAGVFHRRLALTDEVSFTLSDLLRILFILDFNDVEIIFLDQW